MKIDPALPPIAGAQIPLSPDGEPSRPFEDFLGGGVPGRAFGFTEFGMFGREGQAQIPAQTVEPAQPPAESGDPSVPIANLVEPDGRLAAPAQSAKPGQPPAESDNLVVPIESLDEPVGRPPAPAQSTKPGQPPAKSDNLVLPVESLDEPAGRPPKHSPPLVTPALEPGQRPMRVRPTPEARPRVSTAPIASDDAGQALLSPEPGSAGEEAGSAAAAGRRIDRPAQSLSDIGLIISEKGGAVGLVAVGPALDPESCALLRRLARVILARSGLELAQFHLNGVPIAPDSMTMIGGSHGTRTR